MERESIVVGDWQGTIYDISGNRSDWQLSLSRSGSYVRKVSSAHYPLAAEEGNWTLTENSSVLLLTPASGAPTRWVIHDVTGLEFANTLLVLRPLSLGSRVLPILLYRIHPLPGPPIPLDAHGFHSEGPSAS